MWQRGQVAPRSWASAEYTLKKVDSERWETPLSDVEYRMSAVRYRMSF
jgi:hypothetical protein